VIVAISPITSTITPLRLDLIGKSGPALSPTTTGATAGDQASSFSNQIMQAFEKLNQTQNTADMYANQAATGKLKSVQDYMVASNEAQLMTQLTVAVRNKAIEAYNDIMRMGI
jgi:flagellar hook-basal body complex protein FliE